MINSTMSGFLSLEAGMLEIAQRLMGSEKNRVREGLAELLPEFAASIERLPFNKPCRGTRKFCWTEFKMDDVQAIREAAGGTINDVMLTVLTGALARYVKLHGESVNKRLVRIICPVNLRKQGENNQQGNQISFLPLALPLDARGPVGMLQAVTNGTATLKQSGAIALAGLAANWFETVPPILQALFWRNIPDLVMPVSFMNMMLYQCGGLSDAALCNGKAHAGSLPASTYGLRSGDWMCGA